MPTRIQKTAGSRGQGKRESKSVSRSAVKKKTTRPSSTAAAGETGQLREPLSPMPKQHQKKPGIEAKVTPRPRYKALKYKGGDKLKEKVALITGGDSGIGRAVAVLFAREGADVAFTYLPEEEVDARETVRAIEDEGRTAFSISG